MCYLIIPSCYLDTVISSEIEIFGKGRNSSLLLKTIDFTSFLNKIVIFVFGISLMVPVDFCQIEMECF